MPDDDQQQSILDDLSRRLSQLEQQSKDLRKALFLPRPPFPGSDAGLPFMAHSTCCSADFMHPRYVEILDSVRSPFAWHRKQWEWVFIIEKLRQADVLRPGARGLVFGVGTERLPSLFASMGVNILATDAPSDVGAAWKESLQFTNGLSSLLFTDIVSTEDFHARVAFDVCDMNAIPDALTDFDFNWSSCCFEHLGDLEAGMQFVIDAVEKTLKVGGVAVHTTEFNLSSDDDTITSGGTVIFRKRDIEDLIGRLRDRGHVVDDLVVAPVTTFQDHHVDVPPYHHDPHLKLLLGGYVCTSAGLVIRRGR